MEALRTFEDTAQAEEFGIKELEDRQVKIQKDLRGKIAVVKSCVKNRIDVAMM